MAKAKAKYFRENYEGYNKEERKLYFQGKLNKVQMAMCDDDGNPKASIWPSVSNKQKERLEKAQKDKKSTFARATPHLPITAMTATKEIATNIQAKFEKDQKKALADQFKRV